MSEAGSSSPAPGRPFPRTIELPTRETAAPSTAIGRWFSSGGRLDEPEAVGRGYPWYKVVCLTGVDYFSTLAYQPGIALLAAGLLAPTATLVLVAVTLLAALPVYAAVARRSYVGQGSIAMLENLLEGWKSKIFVLVLLGFAATDFVITMTLSAADAARHAVANSFLHPYFGNAQFDLTTLLLMILAIVFFIGFREAINLAVAIVVPFLLLNLVVVLAMLTTLLLVPHAVRRLALDAQGTRGIGVELLVAVAVLLAIFAPYTAEECWALLGHEPSVAQAGWPAADPALLVEDLVTCVVQVSGKVRDRLEVPPGIGEDDLRELALAAPGVVRALGGAGVRTIIVRAPRLVNVVPA